MPLLLPSLFSACAFSSSSNLAPPLAPNSSYGYVHDVTQTLVVLEFAPYGSLWELLCDEGAFPTTQPFSLSLGWIKDLCSAAAHMFKRGVKHGDIKAENLLVYAYPDRLVAKLCDFGFARQSSATMSVASGSTANFEAPEVRSEGKASFASDVFSIGMTAVQILTRQTPGRHGWQEQVVAALADATASGSHGRDHIPSAKVRQGGGGAGSSSPQRKEAAARAFLQTLLLGMTEKEQGRRPTAIDSARALNSIFDGLGGDPRTDMTSDEYDKLEIIEDRVKAARRAGGRTREQEKR